MEFATGAMGTLLPKLGELLQEEYNLKKSVKEGIKDLTAELESMQAALVKVSNVPLHLLDPQVNIWAGEVRELSYAIEDSLDSSMVRIEGLEPTKSNIRGFFEMTRNKITKFKARHEIANNIKDVESRVKKVKERYDRYKIDDVVANLATTKVDPRLSTLYNKVSNLVGIDKAVQELVEMLSEGDVMPEEKLKTFSLVGFGGLGKTTLAKAVYDKLKKKFKYAGFIPVGQNPEMKKVFKDILYELDKKKYKKITASQMDVRQLIDELQEILGEKRYLIVIDDIWDITTWEMIKCALVDSNNGSRIITTTRVREVAKQIGVVYNIRPLSDDNSRKLFHSRIFGGEGASPGGQTVEISDRLINKCSGVPLSIITIASLLVGKRTEDWSKVYDSIGFGHEENEVVENTRKILSFSYYDLPTYLKTCLLHLSIFPEDRLIEKHMLIWRWIAEGFVPNKQGIGLFELGESYFNELRNRSLIRWIEPTRYSVGAGCRVHDMVLDLVRTLSSQVKFVTILDTEKTITSSSSVVHRLALHKRSIERNPGMDMGSLRSFNAISCPGSNMPSLLSFKVLRVLVLEDCEFSAGGCGLEHLGKLIHLRYLGIVDTYAKELPSEIGNDLKFLQTLDVRGSGIEEIPRSVGELNKLMRLRSSKATRMMAGIGKLTSLENLEIYSVDKSPNFAAELGKLKELRALDIEFDEIDDSTQKALLESLCSLHKIQDLWIASSMDESVLLCGLEKWVPPSGFRWLVLKNLCLPRQPSWMNSESAPHLSYLRFEVAILEAQDLRALGRLLSLGCLYLMCRNWLSYNVSKDEFQNLKYLHTDIEITGEEGALPVLEEIECSVRLGSEDNIGLVPGSMPLLEKATYTILDFQDCSDQATDPSAVAAEVMDAALRQAAEIHPNRPTLKIKRSFREVCIYTMKKVGQ
ncbi:hypothetical protein ACQ4PT_018154 [Festuca glaucescens]